MNRKEFYDVYRKLDKTENQRRDLKEIEKEIEIFFRCIEEGISLDGEVQFRNKGSFKLIDRKEKIVSNPSTRERMTIYPGKTIKFKSSKNFYL